MGGDCRRTSRDGDQTSGRLHLRSRSWCGGMMEVAALLIILLFLSSVSGITDPPTSSKMDFTESFSPSRNDEEYSANWETDQEGSGLLRDGLEDSELTVNNLQWRQIMVIGATAAVVIIILLMAAIGLRKRFSPSQSPGLYQLTATAPP